LTLPRKALATMTLIRALFIRWIGLLALMRTAGIEGHR
jgi:hypothetical protein